MNCFMNCFYQFPLRFPENGHFSNFNPKLSPQFSLDHPETWQALTRHNLEQKPLLEFLFRTLDSKCSK